jgi:HEAT repeat protein
MYCTASLVKMGDSNSIPRLMEALRSDNPVVRLKAVELIKDLKDKRTVDILKYKMNYDPSPRVQKAAREALKAMGIEVDESK